MMFLKIHKSVLVESFIYSLVICKSRGQTPQYAIFTTLLPFAPDCDEGKWPLKCQISNGVFDILVGYLCITFAAWQHAEEYVITCSETEKKKKI